MPKRNVTFRLSDEEIAVLDAFTVIKIHNTNGPWTRADSVRFILRKMKPTDELDEQHRVHRDAYQEAFGS